MSDLYLLENAFNLHDFFESKGEIKNQELVTKPYSFFKKLGMIKE